MQRAQALPAFQGAEREGAPLAHHSWDHWFSQGPDPHQGKHA